MVASGGGHHQIGGHTVELLRSCDKHREWQCSVRMFPILRNKKGAVLFSAPFHNTIISHLFRKKKEMISE